VAGVVDTLKAGDGDDAASVQGSGTGTAPVYALQTSPNGTDWADLRELATAVSLADVNQALVLTLPALHLLRPRVLGGFVAGTLSLNHTGFRGGLLA
jgi:hypothetical protein